MLNKVALSFSVALASPLFFTSPLLSEGGSPSDRGRIGWHGETMPEGMVKAEEKGEYRWLKDHSIMVYVPAGTFIMGYAQGDPDEQPPREIHLDAYYIDKYEATNAQWRKSALEMPEPPDWGQPDEKPVVNVDWTDVQAYLEWSGKRLPTEAEWEKAARGDDGRIYPWGNEEPQNKYLVWEEHPQASVAAADVDCCARGASPYGAFNMAGNVYEWCHDWYDADFYKTMPARNPVNNVKAKMRVLRGGAFIYGAKYQRASYRYRLFPFDKTPYIGFRGVVSGQ